MNSRPWQIVPLAGIALLGARVAVGQYEPVWQPRHCDLEYEIVPSDRLYRGTTTLSLENVSKRGERVVSLALYRLQNVEGVEDTTGTALPFTARVVEAPDWRGFRAQSLEVQLPGPAAPGSTVHVRVHHSGPMLGYAEVKRYTKDAISHDFSLLRQDTLAYPQLGPVTDRDLSGNLQAQITAGWTFRLRVVVRKPLVVAASGRQVRRTDVDANRWRYEFESTSPTWRIDVAAAPYSVVERSDVGLRGYFFPADSTAATAAMDVMARSIEAYTKWFGPGTSIGSGYTLIEVPQGYGSQAGAGYFVQTADGLASPDGMRMLAHEIAHAWNVPSREEATSRFLDEAFATYFQALADEVLAGAGGRLRRLEEYRKRYLDAVAAHPEWGQAAIANYGRVDLTDLSYTKGPWVLAVLDEIVGRDAFERTVRTFLRRYQGTGAKLVDFKSVAEEVSNRKLDSFWAEWIEQGAASTALLRQHPDPRQIATRYASIEN